MLASTRKQTSLFCLQLDTLLQVYVRVLQAMSDIRDCKAPPLHPSHCLWALLWGSLDLANRALVLVFATYFYVCVYVCMRTLGPMCVCSFVPIFPPCSHVTITNQALQSCLKRRRKEGGEPGSE